MNPTGTFFEYLFFVLGVASVGHYAYMGFRQSQKESRMGRETIAAAEEELGPKRTLRTIG